jgi:hypothetical protein
MKCKQWIAVLCGGFFFCFNPAVVLGADVLVPDATLRQAGLQSSWQIELPLKPTEQIESLYVVDQYLYILTDRNFFFCIERDSGSVRSLLQLAGPGLPVLRPIQYEKKSVFLIGQEVKVFEPLTGRVSSAMTLTQMSGGYGCIARNKDCIYVCGSDNRLYVFAAQDGTRLKMVTADNDAPIDTVIASENTVWFGTTVGNIVAMDALKHQKLWQYNLTGKMATPLLLQDNSIYAAGLDAKVYKLDAKTGSLEWKEPFITGGRVQEPVVLGKTCVYVFTERTGLSAVNKNSGKAVWNVPQGRAVLAELGDQVYVYNRPTELAVIDNLSGKKTISVNIAGVEKVAVNTTDSVLYLADKAGRIMAAKQFDKKNITTAKP